MAGQRHEFERNPTTVQDRGYARFPGWPSARRHVGNAQHTEQLDHMPTSDYSAIHEEASMTTQTESQKSGGFSQEWDSLYAAQTHLSIWPWSDLVSYICRYAKPAEQFSRVLELGCGAGANIPFFLSRNLDYHAIEGSSSIVNQLISNFPQLKDKIVCGDFTKEIPFVPPFDLVVDRASLTHNDTDSIRCCLKLVSEMLRPGGKFIGIDWFSTDHPDAKKGVPVDSHTQRGIKSRAFTGTGNVHFFDVSHLEELLTAVGLQIHTLEHKSNRIIHGDQDTTTSSFNFVAIKV